MTPHAHAVFTSRIAARGGIGGRAVLLDERCECGAQRARITRTGSDVQTVGPWFEAPSERLFNGRHE